MPWVKFDDNASEDPKIDHLSDGAFRLWFNAICFANRNLTDGFVPAARITRLTPRYKAAHLQQLVDAGLFHKELDGVRIHKYLDYQPSAQHIAEQREYERQKKAKQRTAGAASSRHDGTTGRFVSRRDNQGDIGRDSLRESGRESPATRPVPSLTTPSPSDLRVALGHGSETEDAKATSLALRIHALLASSGKPPPPATQIGLLVCHAAGYLDLAVLDEAIGHLERLNQPPRTLRYVAKTLTDWAGQRGVALPEWRAS